MTPLVVTPKQNQHSTVGNKHKMNMKDIYLIAIIFFPFLLGNCTFQTKLKEKTIERKASKILERFDSTSIEVFRNWEYFERGQADIWTKIKNDSSLYNCIYFESKRPLKFRVLNFKEFAKEFCINIPYDTAFYEITFEQNSNGLIKITGTGEHGHEVLIKKLTIKDSIFCSENPLDKIKGLTAMKDSFNFVKVNYNEKLGGLIQFYLSYEDVLTFIPDTSLIDTKSKKILIDELSKGKWIRNQWNLRKLDKPIDNG